MGRNEFNEMRFTKNKSFIFRKVDDEYILVPIRQRAQDINSLYALNEVAAYVWELIDGKKSIQEIKNMVVEAFDVSLEIAEKDIEDLFTKLRDIEAVSVIA